MCLLLVVLWARSYWWHDNFRPWKHEVWVSFGKVIIDEKWVLSSEHVENQSDFDLTVYETFLPDGTGTTIPIWAPTIGSLLLAAVPWLPLRRFSLRTLLIAATLLAVVLGLAVWSAR